MAASLDPLDHDDIHTGCSSTSSLLDTPGLEHHTYSSGPATLYKGCRVTPEERDDRYPFLEAHGELILEPCWRRHRRDQIDAEGTIRQGPGLVNLLTDEIRGLSDHPKHSEGPRI